MLTLTKADLTNIINQLSEDDCLTINPSKEGTDEIAICTAVFRPIKPLCTVAESEGGWVEEMTPPAAEKADCDYGITSKDLNDTIDMVKAKAGKGKILRYYFNGTPVMSKIRKVVFDDGMADKEVHRIMKIAGLDYSLT